MNYLKHTVFTIIFFITATSFSQVALAPSLNASGESKITAAHQGVYIPNVVIQNVTDAPNVVQKDVRVVSMLVYNTTANDQLTTGYYFWNGNQWNIYDTTVTPPNSGLVLKTNPKTPSSPTTVVNINGQKVVSL